MEKPVNKKIRQTASLFVGRWQPFHKGHLALIETVLKKGKPVVVAIRDTEISEKNPYSTAERWDLIQRALKKYGSLVKIIVIPDIDEICYGREVGYAIREITMPAEVKKISGTKVRKENFKRYPIYWITGQTGSGKTTLAEALRKKIGGTVLDGDEMRESISLGAGFSKEDRTSHNLRVARLALALARQGPVIVAVIAPFEDVRKQINSLVKPVWIYLARSLPAHPDKPYQIPKNPDIILDSDIQTTKQQVGIVIKALKNLK